MFIALIKLSLFFSKGEPGKPGEQGFMASIAIYLFLLNSVNFHTISIKIMEVQQVIQSYGQDYM